MATHSYLSIKGNTMGLISAGCSTQDSIGNKCQAGHTHQILVLSVDHQMTSISNTAHDQAFYVCNFQKDVKTNQLALI